MAILKSLIFMSLPTIIGADAMLDGRTKIIARLEEQKLLLKDPNYTRTVWNWIRKDGQLVMIKGSSACRGGGDNSRTALTRCSLGRD
jgi:hypothetical protein